MSKDAEALIEAGELGRWFAKALLEKTCKLCHGDKKNHIGEELKCPFSPTRFQSSLASPSPTSPSNP